MIITGAAIAAGVASQESDEAWVRAAVPVVVGAGATGYMLSFGRSQELEADRLGMRYAARAGYDPHALVGVLEVLKAESDAAGGGSLEIFSTHPDPARRITLAQRELADTYAGASGERFADRFHRQVEPMREVSEVPGGAVSVMWCAPCRVAAERSAQAE